MFVGWRQNGTWLKLDALREKSMIIAVRSRLVFFLGTLGRFRNLLNTTD
jgi:hypothetical protein